MAHTYADLKSMKHLMLLCISFLSFSNPAAAKDFNFEVPYLTHEEFVNLYEADQREYVILLRKAAADFSYEDQLSFFQRFNFQAPVWAAIFSTQASAEPANTAAQIIAQVNDAQNQAQAVIDLLNRPERTIVNRALYAVGLGERPAEDFYTGSTDPLRSKKVAIFNALRARQEAVAMISQPGPKAERQRLRDKLKSTEPTFAKLREEARAMTDNKRFREDFDRYVIQYESLFSTPIFEPRPEGGVLAHIVGPMRRSRTARPAAAPARTAAAPVANERTEDSARTAAVAAPAPVTASAGQCVRCIYAGFVISDNEKCEPVNSGAEMTAQVGPLKFPPPLTADEMNCEGSKPVMCNPLLFGLKNSGPLCVSRSASATRSCMATAGTGPETTGSTARMIHDNKPAYDRFKAKIGSICKNVGTQCYSAARRNDIRQTCAAIRESALAFAGRMRSYSRPAGGAGSAPVRVNN